MQTDRAAASDRHGAGPAPRRRAADRALRVAGAASRFAAEAAHRACTGAGTAWRLSAGTACCASLAAAALLAVHAVAPSPARAQSVYACEASELARAYFDPCPSPDGRDLTLPMPMGLQMTLRWTEVPGADFWHDPSRIVRMGNPNAPIYEAPRVVSVAGSFPAPDGRSWRTYLGKYEVTVAQFIAVMGDGDLEAGVRELLDRSRQAPGEPALEEYLPLDRDIGSAASRQALAAPVRNLAHGDYREFLDRYTAWCVADPDCRDALPSLDGYPGLFRFPTETEWEYVARGGIDPDAEPAFDWTSPLPFERSAVQLYARAAPTSERTATVIGRYRATDGFHDMFGNVRELMENRFTSEPGQGRVGGYALRGGGFMDDESRLHAGARHEFAIWRKTEAAADAPLRRRRPRDVGFRLALGTPVAATDAFQARIEAEYAAYREVSAPESGEQQNSAPALTRAAASIGRLEDLLAEMRRIPANEETVSALEGELDTVVTILRDEALKVAVELVEEATAEAAEIGRLLRAIDKDEAFLRENPAQPGDSAVKTRIRARAEQRLAAMRPQAQRGESRYVDKIFGIVEYREQAPRAVELVAALDFDAELERPAFEVVRRHIRELLEGRQDVARWAADLHDIPR